MKLPVGIPILPDATLGPLRLYLLVRLLTSGALTGYCEATGVEGNGYIFFEQGRLHLPCFTAQDKKTLYGEDALKALRVLTVENLHTVILKKAVLDHARIICQSKESIREQGLSADQFRVKANELVRRYPDSLFQLFLDDEEHYLLYIASKLVRQPENNADFETFLNRGSFNLNLYPFDNPLPPPRFYQSQDLLPTNWITQIIITSLEKEFGSDASGLIGELRDEVIPPEKLNSRLDHVDEFLGMFVCSSKQARRVVKNIEKEVALLQTQIS